MCVSTFQFFMGARYLISLSHGEKVTPIQEKRGRPLFYFIFLIVMECINGRGGEGCGVPHYVRVAVSDFANSTVTFFPRMERPRVERMRMARADSAAVSYLMRANPRMVP